MKTKTTIRTLIQNLKNIQAIENLKNKRFVLPVFFAVLVLTSFLFVAVSCFATDSQNKGNAIFGAKSFRLSNGLQAVWIPNHRAPVVHHMIWYKVGSADEPSGKSGLAHFFEHLMFKGTRRFPDGIFSQTINALGGQDNAFTSYDYTAYHQSIPKEHLGVVMDMEADRMKNLRLTKDVIETERQVILEERKQRVDSSAFARYGEKENTILYVNHPYANPVIGWEHEIKNLSEKDLKEFYQKWYAPNNAVVVVAGDISFEDFKKAVKKYYGGLKPSPHLLTRNRPKIPENIFEGLDTVLTFKDKQIAQNYLRKKFLVPSQRQDEETSFALEIIAEELGYGQSSLLYRSLVEEKKIALSVGASYSGDLMDSGSFTVFATLAKDVSFETVEREINQVIRGFVRTGISEQRLSEIKKRFTASSIFARDSLTTPAYIFGRALSTGLTLDDVEYWEERFEKIDKEKVDAVLKEYFSDFENNKGVKAFLMPEIDIVIEKGKP